MKSSMRSAGHTVKEVALFFSVCFLAACPIAAIYTGQVDDVLPGLLRILTSPAPLITDYYRLGNLPATLLNAGLCGMACTAMMILPRAACEGGTWSGYFLVVAHCFYGLNFINMWPPILGILLYCRVKRVSFRDNLAMAMYSTAFAPFVSELLFRYPFSRIFLLDFGFVSINLFSLLAVALLCAFLGFAIPAMLPGAQLLHRGFNLYNGGLAFGLLGLLVYAFLYPTLGITAPVSQPAENPVYEAHGCSYAGFCNLFFLFVFGCCLVRGWLLNGRSFAGYGTLLKDNGHRSEFMQDYGIPCTWINLGVYGLMMLGYYNVVILLTEGAGFTGPTSGVLLAAMTFAATGQHPRNVWPIIGGFVLLSAIVTGLFVLSDRPVPWTLSTQGYMDGLAFATGLCPFTGCYGRKVGILAGLICAVICTTTSVMHGGLVLYNGGLAAGIAALILTPMLDHFSAHRFVQ